MHVCLDIMDEIAEVCRPAVVLTGGEPLLREDVFDLAAYGKSLGFKMGLATNGMGVTDSVASKIQESGICRVGISLDGPNAASHDAFRRVPGAFDGALAAMGRLKSLGIYVQVNTSVTTHNARQLDEILQLVQDLNIDAWHLFLLVPVGCGLQIAADYQIEALEYERILDWLYEKSKSGGMDLRAVCAPHYMRVRAQRILQDRKSGVTPQPYIAPGTKAKSGSHPSSGKGCLAGSGMCFISHTGEIFPCGYLPVKAGDLKQQSFEEIWSRSAVLQEIRNPDLLEGKCGICEFRHICLGCRARAYGITGDYLAEEPLCIYEPGGAAQSGDPVQ